MEVKDILAISGQPGLYLFIARSNNGVIVESLSDKKRSNATGASKTSSLAEIAIYTESEDMPLWKVMTALYEHMQGKETISHKSDPAQIKKLFAEILPGYDRDRVHVSDMKKLLAWYNILVGAGMTDFTVEEEEDAAESAEKQPKNSPKPDDR